MSSCNHNAQARKRERQQLAEEQTAKRRAKRQKKKAKQAKKGGQADDGKDDKDLSSGDDSGPAGEGKGLDQADLD
jgi:hypothetical protein